MDLSVRICFAELKDSLDILRWRNDTLTRSMSRNEDLIDVNSHTIWYSGLLKDSDRLLLIGVVLEQSIGMVRFDRLHAQRSWEVSITLAPEHRGKGLGRKLLKAALLFFSFKHPNAELVAEIKPCNATSRKLFEACGFNYHSSEEHVYRFRQLVD